MGSQVSAKTNDKEQQLKKASKMALDPFAPANRRTGCYFPVIQCPDRFPYDGKYVTGTFTGICNYDCSYGRISSL